MTGSVLGERVGIPVRRRATLGTLYVFATRDGLVRRAPVRIDSAHSSHGLLQPELVPLGRSTGDEEPGRIRIAPRNSRR